jgi:hypothetical protein
MPESFPRQSEQVAARTIEGAAYLVDPRTSTFFELNPVATRIWELCDGTHSVGDIAAELTKEFEVDTDTAMRDVRSTMDEFTRIGLVCFD